MKGEFFMKLVFFSNPNLTCLLVISFDLLSNSFQLWHIWHPDGVGYDRDVRMRNKQRVSLLSYYIYNFSIAFMFS